SGGVATLLEIEDYCISPDPPIVCLGQIVSIEVKGSERSAGGFASQFAGYNKILRQGGFEIEDGEVTAYPRERYAEKFNALGVPLLPLYIGVWSPNGPLTLNISDASGRSVEVTMPKSLTTTSALISRDGQPIEIGYSNRPLLANLPGR
ncbi:unnamed protein product, partial [marine sediment metagenome]